MTISAESGTCQGKGFDDTNANGFLAKLANFLRRPVAAGAWQAVTVNDASTMTVSSLPATGTEVVFKTDNGAVLPTGIVAGASYFVINNGSTISLDTTYSDAIAGSPTPISWAANGSGSFYLQINGGGAGWFQLSGAGGIFCDTNVPFGTEDYNPNDISSGPTGGAPKYVHLAPSDVAGKVAVQFHLFAVTSGGGALAGGVFAGYLLDASDGQYLYDFRAGNGYLGIKSRVGSNWSTAIIDDFTGGANLLENFSSTITGIATAGSDVVVPVDMKPTVGKRYYLIDLSAGVAMVEYVKVTAFDSGAGTCTIQTLSQDFDSGSILAAYAHRYYTTGTGNPVGTGAGFNAVGSSTYAQLPYYPSTDPAHVIDAGSAAIDSAITACISPYALGIGPVQRVDAGGATVAMPSEIAPLARANDGAGADMNAAPLGTTKNLLFAAKGSMVSAQDTLTVGASSFIFFSTADQLFAGGSADIAVLEPNS